MMYVLSFIIGMEEDCGNSDGQPWESNRGPTARFYPFLQKIFALHLIFLVSTYYIFE